VRNQPENIVGKSVGKIAARYRVSLPESSVSSPSWLFSANIWVDCRDVNRARVLAKRAQSGHNNPLSHHHLEMVSTGAVVQWPETSMAFHGECVGSLPGLEVWSA
jgi:hypothetical protein